jgi:hypothetical protein
VVHEVVDEHRPGLCIVEVAEVIRHILHTTRTCQSVSTSGMKSPDIEDIRH